MKIVALFIIGFFFLACEEKKDSSSSNKVPTVKNERSFYMGFTPWLYAATAQAESDVYSFINSKADLVAHHFQQGIPFNDSSTFPNFSNYETNIQNEINNRINLTDSNKVIYLAVDSLNASRDDLTDFWGTSANTARPAPWDTRSFDDVEVITAYINFSLELIARFNPTYFNYGSEVSDLMINSPAKFIEYKTFAQAVYTNLKAAYPNLKIMASIALKAPGSANMQTVTTGFNEIKDYVDVVGISTYGYAFYGHADAGDPDNLPTDWLSQIKTIAPNKPYGVVETGWIGESLSIPAYSLSVSSNEEKQEKYLKKLFVEANEMNMETMIWFTSHDYDTLWSTTLGSDNLSKIWKDTGLFDGALNRRESADLWEEWEKYSKK